MTPETIILGVVAGLQALTLIFVGDILRRLGRLEGRAMGEIHDA